MPSITLNKDVFEKLVGKKLPIEKLKDRISMMGTDLEGIEGNNIEVEIFPNRPDLLSEQGFARAFSSFIGVKPGMRKYPVKKSGKQVIVDKNVSMRPYTACAIVKNLKFDDDNIKAIMQAQEKLAVTHGRNRKKSAYGIYPSDKINFPVKYTARDPKKVEFWPLGFPKPIRADDIEELHPKAIEYKHITKGWKTYPFFVDDKENIMCMLPYTNSHDTGKVDETTTEVFVECTGNDFQNVNSALNMFVTMLGDMGGEIYSIEMVYPDKTFSTPNLEPTKLKFDLEYLNKRLGLELKESEAKTLLEKMGYGYEKGHALVPAYRADVLHQIDLAEDLAIAYGYENFEEIIPKVATIGEESKIESFKRTISQLLIGLKLSELYTYNIASSEEIEKKFLGKKPVMLANSLSEGFDCMRNSMLPSLLHVLTNNRHNEYPQHIFDIGTIFTKDKKEDIGVLEEESLSVALCDEKVDFTKIKQVLDYVFHNLAAEYMLKETNSPSFLEGRCGEIIVKGKKLGIIGEVSPEVITNYGIDYPIVAFELNISKLFELI